MSASDAAAILEARQALAELAEIDGKLKKSPTDHRLWSKRRKVVNRCN